VINVNLKHPVMDLEKFDTFWIYITDIIICILLNIVLALIISDTRLRINFHVERLSDVL
jgi:hypothetical protein